MCLTVDEKDVGSTPTVPAFFVENYNDKKERQLGMKPGTATGILRKRLLFSLAQRLSLDVCFHCQTKISSPEEFSIEHKTPWLDSEKPIDLFFNLDNIAFSHLRCNSRAARKPHKKYFTPEERLEATRKGKRESEKRRYTTTKRQAKYQRTGH